MVHAETVIGTIVLLSLLCAWCPAAAPATQRQSLPDKEQIHALMRRAADYQLVEQRTKKFDNDWIRSAFYAGVMAGDPF